MTATRGAFERRVEARLKLTVESAVVLAVMAVRAVVLARGWVADHRGGAR